MRWLCAASNLPGKALNVGIYIWHLVGMTDSTTVKLPKQKLNKDFGVNRHAVNRSIIALEKSGLITVERRPGCCATVTLIFPTQS